MINDLTSGGWSILARLRSRSPYLDGSSAERTMEEAAEEIERLEADLSVAEANLNIAKANLHSERLINERLEAALASIAAHDDQFSGLQQARAMRDVARRALEPKP